MDEAASGIYCMQTHMVTQLYQALIGLKRTR